MEGLVGLAGSLLSLAHRIFGPAVCPGDWVWATVTAGGLVALSPVLGAMIVALVRKGTGNTYNGATVAVFGVLGAGFTALLPLLLFNGVSTVFFRAFARDPSGLSRGELATLRSQTCVGWQGKHLGGGQTVYEVLLYPSEGTPMVLLRIATLVGLPLLALLFVLLQARAAFRRGPKWPARLIWIPFLLVILFSVGLKANTAAWLWLGFVPASVLGMIPVLIVGPPRWSVIERAYQRPESGQYPPPPAQQPVPGPAPQRPPTPPPRPVPGPPPPSSPQPVGKSAAPLADQPGPLPFAAAAVPPAPAQSGLWQGAGGRFRKVRALGHGGFGTVWLAVDTQLDRTVAVKVAHAPDAEAEERMLREARALAAVHHPNCVRVYDIISDAAGLGIVMEYIDGQQLADNVSESGPLGDVAAARLWLTMAGALSAAHAKGVLHRDVKPANVLVDPDGNPHLIDFGIARSRGDSTLTATGMMVGTPDFLAPETAGGAAATPASDAWQLAATVSFALTGSPPRGGRENAMAALMAAARAEPINHLPRHSRHLPLLLASLDPNPARRPTLRAIEHAMSGWLARAGHAEQGPVTRVVLS